MDVLQYGKAICYSGYRAGQSPKTVCPSKEEIRQDLLLLAGEGFRYIRMYDPNLHARRALEVIREEGLPIRCLIGIDSDPESNNDRCPFEKQNFTPEQLRANAARNDAEVDRLIELVREYEDEVAAVSVGNENTPFWGAHLVSPERLMGHARRLKEALDKPVTFCEGIFEWPHIQELGHYLDFISVHSYPLHYGRTVDEAVDMNRRHYERIKAMFPDKQVLFTEVGWTTHTVKEPRPEGFEQAFGPDMPEEMEGMVGMRPEQANVPNQKRYITELSAWLEKEQIIGFIFEAFDEPWKASGPEKSECNWGLYRLDRPRKW